MGGWTEVTAVASGVVSTLTGIDSDGNVGG